MAGFNISPTSYDMLSWILRHERREYISGPELAAALRANRHQPMPDEVFDYLCKFLDGKVRKPAGRRPKAGLVDIYKRLVARLDYEKELEDIRARNRARKAKTPDWKPADAAHAEAAEIIRKRHFKHMSSRSFLNMLSLQKNS